MSSLTPDEYPEEFWHQAAKMVVDDHKDLRAVAQSLEVEEEHLGKAVYYLRENRARAARRWREAQRRRGATPIDIERAAQEFRTSQERLLQLVETADDKELMSTAVGLAWTLRLDTKKFAQVLGINEGTLGSRVQQRKDDDMRQQATLRNKGLLPPLTPHYVEDPPS